MFGEGAELKRQRRKDGTIYRYRWGEGGKKNSCTRCTDFSVDGDL